MIILPPDVMADDHIKELRENGICVVVATDPARVRFVDSIPAIANRDAAENAALALSRKVLNPNFWSNNELPNWATKTFIEALVKGTSLDPRPTQEEREAQAYDHARIEEARRLGREEARAERERAKAEAAAAKEKKGASRP